MHSGDVYVYLVSISHLVLLSSVAHSAHLCHCAMGIGAVQFLGGSLAAARGATTLSWSHLYVDDHEPTSSPGARVVKMISRTSPLTLCNGCLNAKTIC